MNFFETKLGNNLTIVGEQRETAKSAAVAFFTKTGARDEDASVSGVSHFLEHMMFKGTAKRDALKLTFDLAGIGAQANAYTTEETTVYYATLLPEYLFSGLEILSDMLRPTLDENEFNVEKKVILEEIALYKDRPTYVMFETALREFFSGHAAGNSVLGSTESITALTRPQMKNYFDSRYVPSNMVLAVSGKFDWDAFVAEAAKYCAHWQDRAVTRNVVSHTPKNSEKVITKEGLQQAHLCLLTLGPSARDDIRYAANVLCCILGDSSGSKCYWELVDKGLADSASISADEMDGTGFMYAYASCDPENLDKVEGILRAIFSAAKDFSEEDLELAKTKIATRLVLQGESTRSRLMAIGNQQLYLGTYLSLESELKKIKNISKKDILQALEKFPLHINTKLTLRSS